MTGFKAAILAKSNFPNLHAPQREERYQILSLLKAKHAQRDRLIAGEESQCRNHSAGIAVQSTTCSAVGAATDQNVQQQPDRRVVGATLAAHPNSTMTQCHDGSFASICVGHPHTIHLQEVKYGNCQI